MREQQFGKLLAIASILFEKQDKIKLYYNKYAPRFENNPMDTLVKMHEEIVTDISKLDEHSMILFEMFGEILANMDIIDFTNDKLKGEYHYHEGVQRNNLRNLMSAEEASELWGLSAGTIKNYCAEGKVNAVKIGKTWVIDKEQANPAKK